jgi:hypothetical protein
MDCPKLRLFSEPPAPTATPQRRPKNSRRSEPTPKKRLAEVIEGMKRSRSAATKRGRRPGSRRLP